MPETQDRKIIPVSLIEVPFESALSPDSGTREGRFRWGSSRQPQSPQLWWGEGGVGMGRGMPAHTQEQATLVTAGQRYRAISQECGPLRPLKPSPSRPLLKNK